MVAKCVSPPAASNPSLPFATQLSSKWCGTGRRRRDAEEKEEEERKLLIVNTAALCSFLSEALGRRGLTNEMEAIWRPL